ncbi:MAG: M48 family metallopeptidase [Puniceicoccaceae bacterium]
MEGPTMDFFGSQDRARSRTKTLIALYFAAMALIIVAIYAVFVVAGFGGALDDGAPGGAARPAAQTPVNWFDPGLFAIVAGGVVLIIAGASFFKIRSLGSGGASVARSMGGEPIDSSTADPDERKLLNVVEEMSIASGVPMPDVFILEGQQGINAFAAGYDVEDAAIAVTRGAIRQLSRDELQGVVAHEFSHVLSGDMRLNIRLIGPLFGLLVIAFLGRMFLYSGGGRGRGKNQGGLVLVGLAIMVIGYIGVFFGRLIQAAISRQREYLADASAVQFTRNPAGIGNALRRLGHGRVGSKVEHAHSSDTAHMFFADALGSSLATHPPLPKRIRKVLPGWDGTFLPPRKEPAPAEEGAPPRPEAAAADRGRRMVTAASAIAAIGAVSSGGIRSGIEQRIRIRRQVGDIPLDTKKEAGAALFALILDPDPGKRRDQIRLLEELTGADTAALVSERAEQIDPLSASERYGLMELCYPGLRRFDAAERSSFEAALDRLARQDQALSLREMLVLEVVRRQFDSPAHGKKRSHRLNHDTDRLAPLAGDLLFLVASLETGDDEEAAAAVRDAVSKQYLLSGKVALPEKPMAIGNLGPALDALAKSGFGFRRQVLSAAADLVLRDEETTDREWTLLRLISLSLGAPMPPLEAG